MGRPGAWRVAARNRERNGLARGVGRARQTGLARRRIKVAPPDYGTDLKMAPCAPFAELVEVLKPGATGSDIAKMLDGKANRRRALHWKAGRAKPPAWACDMLKEKLRQRHERERKIADRLEPGPGLKAGARNLAEYLARKT